MKRIVVFALVLNAALLGVIAHQLVAIAGGGAVATQNGDTNGDGNRDIGDAIYLLQWLFVGGEEPVAFAQEGGGLTPEQEEILDHMSIIQLPVDDDGNTAKAIRFTGVNVQVVNGMGSTWGEPGVTPRQFGSHRTNGLGNLIVGYQETRTNGGDDRTGSHNLVVGTNNNYSIWGGQVVGHNNTLSGFLSTVSGGEANTASGPWSTVGGGDSNTASADYSTVSGGRENIASAVHSTVSGGWNNAARGEYSTVGGGGVNRAIGFASTVSGGENNAATGGRSNVGGGRHNSASGDSSTVSGGGGVLPGLQPNGNTASGDYSMVGGGENNTATHSWSWIGGGRHNQSTREDDGLR